MASGTITGYTNNEHIDAKVEWSSTANKTANTSTVKAALYYKRNNTGWQTYGSGSFSITINGTKTKVTKSITITNSDWVLACEATVTVSHNGDGSKSITISATGSLTGTTLTSTTLEGTAKLDLIARASTISSVPFYDVTLGKKYGMSDGMNVVWTPLNASFRYRLIFSLGSWSLDSGVIHPNRTSAYEYTVDLPLDVANQIPNATKGTMTVKLYTYSDYAGKTQVGDPSSKTFTVVVPDNADTKPNATLMTLTPIHSLGDTFSGLYIQWLSKVKVTTSTEGKYGAKVVWQSVSVDGKDYGSGSDYTSDYLSGYGNISVKLTLKDSRGFTNSKTMTISVIPYSKPRVIAVTGEANVACGRCDQSGAWSDSGTYLKIKARRSYSLCMADGVQKNFCGLRYRYKKVTDDDYTDWINLLVTTDLSTEEVITSPLLNGTLSTNESYMVQVDAVDSIPNHTSITFTIPTEKVYMHEAGSIRSLGIGEYVETPNTLSIAEDIAVKVKNSINGVFMGTKVVSGVNSFDIQTKYADFTATGNGNERQTLFLFGAANASLVYGLARVSNSGVTQWQGTEGVTLSSKAGGILTVTLPATAYDLFTVISSRKFTL